MKNTLFSIIALFAFFQVSARQGKSVFTDVSHDFGQIKEENGKAEFTFKFKNEGAGPIRITYVKASCGCTTPSWSKEPVARGESGFVKVVYNPQGRPGSFSKTITVRTDGEPQAMVLRIRGIVIPRPKGLNDIYSYEVGNLRFNSNYISFKEVMAEGKKEFNFSVYNQGAEPITFDLEGSKIPAFINFKPSSLVVNPKDSVNLSLTFDANQKRDWGFVYGGIFLKTDDKLKADKRLGYSARIREDFSNLEKDAPRPKLVFEQDRHDYGKIQQNDKSTAKFVFTNEGNADLLIRKVKASCGCTAVVAEKSILKPNESTYLEVTFSSGTRKGNQKKSITVITNDPNNDEQILWIEAEILSAEKKEK
ncbi:MAG: hypothetical protein ACI81T_003270 [Bacteroidia bacterium]|jgi:hypothetical protein